jgi:hypothetical protein
VIPPTATAFAVQALHVPVRFVITPEAGVPRAGVTNVAEVTRTTFPVPENPTEDGTPVLVVLNRKPVANPESRVPLSPTTVVAPPVDVLVASPVRAVNVPLPPPKHEESA